MYVHNNSEVIKMSYKENENETKDYELDDSTDKYKMKLGNTIKKTDKMIEAEKKLTEELKK